MPRNLRSSTKKRTIRVHKPRYWTKEEHDRFLEGVARFGRKDVDRIAEIVQTKNRIQVRTHAQKYFLKLAKQLEHAAEQRIAEETEPEVPITPTRAAEIDTFDSTPYFLPPLLHDSFYRDLFPEADLFPSMISYETLDSEGDNESETIESLLSPVKFLPPH